MGKSYHLIDLIRAEAETIENLHRRIHTTFPMRDKHKKGYDEWSQACKNFHSYQSRLLLFIKRIYNEPSYTDIELQEFVLTFLEIDPWFFRSGYHKEEMLRRIKRSPLKKAQQARLRAVLIDAARRRGSREYRRYCRLAVGLADEILVQELKQLAISTEKGQASRAKMMLQYIYKHGAHE
jgi:hypothetical protein